MWHSYLRSDRMQRCNSSTATLYQYVSFELMIVLYIVEWGRAKYQVVCALLGQCGDGNG